MKKFNDARDWFFEERFGMFVHFGIYSILKWHEQILWRGKIKRAEYEKLVDSFNPKDFNPKEWIKVMKDAGMTYICFTTKHHDGFCMWDSKYTEYKITNTPYGKDFLKLLSVACHEEGIGFGLYYSLPDWNHPNYPNIGRHHEMFFMKDGDVIDEDKYLEYVKNQVHELITGYGKINQFFWDVNVAEFVKPEINEMIRKAHPGCVINDRGPSEGDFKTPERRLPDGMVFDIPTEAVQSLGRESWSYREKEDYYTDKFLMQSIAKIMAMGGNYQLNVGPRPDGCIDERDINILKRIGDWYKRVNEAFIGAIPCTYLLTSNENKRIDYDEVLLTRKGRDIYVIIFKDLKTSGVMLHPIDFMPQKAVLLNNGQEVKCVVDITPWRYTERPALRIYDLPVNEITDEPLIVKLSFSKDL